jgi:hypothetical protein
MKNVLRKTKLPLKTEAIRNLRVLERSELHQVNGGVTEEPWCTVTLSGTTCPNRG